MSNLIHQLRVRNLAKQIVKAKAAATKYRAECAGINENVWSNNGMEHDTIEQAKSWLDGLSTRWFGYDMGRVVSADTPLGETINTDTQDIYQNFRKK